MWRALLQVFLSCPVDVGLVPFCDGYNQGLCFAPGRRPAPSSSPCSHCFDDAPNRFPNVSTKGRGYQIRAMTEGPEGWEELRKVSVWQTTAALQQEMEAKMIKAREEMVAARSRKERKEKTAFCTWNTLFDCSARSSRRLLLPSHAKERLCAVLSTKTYIPSPDSHYRNSPMLLLCLAASQAGDKESEDRRAAGGELGMEGQEGEGEEHAKATTTVMVGGAAASEIRGSRSGDRAAAMMRGSGGFPGGKFAFVTDNHTNERLDPVEGSIVSLLVALHTCLLTSPSHYARGLPSYPPLLYCKAQFRMVHVGLERALTSRCPQITHPDRAHVFLSLEPWNSSSTIWCYRRGQRTGSAQGFRGGRGRERRRGWTRQEQQR